MANITQLIKNIRNAIFGKDVRESIASAIEQCYEDASNQGNANMEVVDARGNYDTLKKRLDGDKTNLQSQISGLASGSPLVASSVEGMTDTSRVYVNTTNGHWYYYNGSAWTDGGEYQAAEDSTTVQNLVTDKVDKEGIDQVTINNCDFITNKTIIDNIINKKSYKIGRLLNSVGGWENADNHYLTIMSATPISYNTSYILSNNFQGQDCNKYVIKTNNGLYNQNDVIKAKSNITENTPITVPNNENAKYIFFTFYSASEWTEETATEFLKKLTLEEGTTITPYTTPKIENIDLPKYDEKIEELKANIKTNLFIDKTELQNKQLNNAGWTEDAQGYSTNSKGIHVEGNKIYSFNISGFPQNLIYIAFKTADDITSTVQATFISRTSNKCFVKAPATAKYMFFTTSSSSFNNVECYEGFSQYTPISKSLFTYGKTLMTLGDSLTEAGIWQTILAGKLGFSKVINYGVGGTKVNVFADNVTAENIADVDVVTIMGFFNSSSSQPGSVSDEASNGANASICANYKYIIDKLLTLKPVVKIILMTPHCPQAQDGSAKAEAVKQIAQYYNLPCIDLYNEAGFNTYTFDSYLRDAVHSSYGVNGGYEQEANVICGGMLKYLC